MHPRDYTKRKRKKIKTDPKTSNKLEQLALAALTSIQESKENEKPNENQAVSHHSSCFFAPSTSSNHVLPMKFSMGINVKKTGAIERTTQNGPWTSFTIRNGRVAYYKISAQLAPTTTENTSENGTSMSSQHKFK